MICCVHTSDNGRKIQFKETSRPATAHDIEACHMAFASVFAHVLCSLHTVWHGLEQNGPFPLLRHTPESAWCILVVVVKPADICSYGDHTVFCRYCSLFCVKSEPSHGKHIKS